MLRIARIKGTSMAPTLEDGDFVIALGAPWAGSPRAGDVVLARHPELGLIVKRVREIDPAGRLHLAGDNPFSRAPELLGAFDANAIVGRAWLRVGRPPGGVSWMRRRTPPARRRRVSAAQSRPS